MSKVVMGKVTDNIDTIRNERIKIARELCYPNAVIEKLAEAQSEEECNRILRTARNRMAG